MRRVEGLESSFSQTAVERERLELENQQLRRENDRLNQEIKEIESNLRQGILQMHQAINSNRS